MTETFVDILPHLLLMVAGGLATSLGLVRAARGERGRRVLSRVRWWALALAGVVSTAVAVGVAIWVVRRMLGTAPTAAALVSPWTLLLFGVVLGVPLALPGLVVAWSEARPEKAAERKRKGAAATRADRRAYAEKLLGQILEASPEPRELEVGVGGDGGRVLRFEGRLTRQEGERLTEALRADLEEVGFKRVECEGPSGQSWWTRV